jgi:hypothetical protein
VTGESDLIAEAARAILRTAIENLSEGFDDADPRPDKIVAAVGPSVARVRSAFGLLRDTYDAAVAAGESGTGPPRSGRRA